MGSKILYIGQLTEGTTSKMRANKLKSILSDFEFEEIDTNDVFLSAPSIVRTIGFRYKRGPLISKMNNFVRNKIGSYHYEIIWVDKGIYLDKKTTKALRTQSNKLVHYTPDCAFYAEKSHLLNANLKEYDLCITTKTFEKEAYLKYIPEENLHLASQAYDAAVHYPKYEICEKFNRVAFIGLFEPYRGEVIKNLLENKIEVILGGMGWSKFVKENPSPLLTFAGERVFGEDYNDIIGRSYFALGLLSKRFKENHTTRTFEIPACGTILITEENEETKSFFNPDEVIFFKEVKEIAPHIHNINNNKELVLARSRKGREKVVTDNRSYEEMLKQVLYRLK